MKNAAEAYKQNAVENAPPIKIVRMLYAGALRFLGQAEAFDPTTETVQFNDRIRRAEAIVSELRLALDMQQNPEVCGQLEQLYVFVEDELREAFLARDKTHVANAKEILQTLGEAWDQVKLDSAANIRIEDEREAA